MSRRTLSVPTYRLHRQSGQAVVTLRDGVTRRRDVLLGRHGTAASRAEYARLVAQALRAVRALPPNVDGVRHTTPAGPAFWGQVEAVLLHCPPPRDRERRDALARGEGGQQNKGDVPNDGGPPRPSKSATVADINSRSKLLQWLVLG
jgi:hypothetical protein